MKINRDFDKDEQMVKEITRKEFRKVGFVY